MIRTDGVPTIANYLRRPRLLDLFCGAGGAATGYHRVGFDVVGVDINPQPNYPFRFVQADALDALRTLLSGDSLRVDGRQYFLRDFAGIHASPPRQAYSDLQKQNKREYPDLVEPVRERLQKIGLPYVIENVEGAPLHDPILLCGEQFPELRVIRHRLFESNIPIPPLPGHPKHGLTFTRDKRKRHFGKCDEWTCNVQVTGGGNSSVAAARDAMGIDWMTKKELNEAIPPAYTEYIGRHLLDYITAREEQAA